MKIKKWIPSLRFALPIFIVGLIIIGIGINLQSKRLDHKKRSILVSGTVIDLDSVDTSEGFSITPVIECRSPKGQLIQFKSDVSSLPSGYTPGDKVMVLFDPISGKCIINSPFVIYAPIILSGLLGGFFVFFGIAPYILTILIAKKKINMTISNSKKAI
jgi:hypothetical protein